MFSQKICAQDSVFCLLKLWGWKQGWNERWSNLRANLSGVWNEFDKLDIEHNMNTWNQTSGEWEWTLHESRTLTVPQILMGNFTSVIIFPCCPSGTVTSRSLFAQRFTVGHSCLLKAQFTPNYQNYPIHTLVCIMDLKSRTISVSLHSYLEDKYDELLLCHQSDASLDFLSFWCQTACGLAVCDKSCWCLKLDSHLRIAASTTNIRQSEIFSIGWRKHGSFWMGTVFKGLLHTFWMTGSLAFSD